MNEVFSMDFFLLILQQQLRLSSKQVGVRYMNTCSHVHQFKLISCQYYANTNKISFLLEENLPWSSYKLYLYACLTECYFGFGFVSSGH